MSDYTLLDYAIIEQTFFLHGALEGARRLQEMGYDECPDPVTGKVYVWKDHVVRKQVLDKHLADTDLRKMLLP